MRKGGNPNLPRTHGGPRKGSGRKPDWLREQCAKIIENRKLLPWLGRVAAGLETETQFAVVKDGEYSSRVEKFEIPCNMKDRLHAFELLAERGYGRPTTPITLDATENFAEILAGARQTLNGSPTVQ